MKKVSVLLCLLVCSLGCWAKVQERSVQYRSVDQHGVEITLSGLMSVPEGGEIKGVFLVPHYTITADREAPSRKATGEAKYLRDEYILLMPDYIGYGITRERVHPYLYGELSARNTVDLLLAMRAEIDSIAPGMADSVYLLGYSQGGATALWTLRLIEEEYKGRIGVKHCFVGSGPHDVASTYDMYMKEKKSFFPALIPMLVVGTSEAYDLNLNLDEFFTKAMHRVYEKYIVTKEKKMMQIYFKTTNHNLAHWLTPKAMDKTQAETKQLYEGLLRSSMVHYSLDGSRDSICPKWQPQAKTFVFHSTNDNVVPYCNSVHLRRCYGGCENIKWDFDRYGGHIRSMDVFMAKVKDILSD